MSRNKDYQRLLNSKRWRELRMWKLEHNPLCEMCQRAGYVRAAVDIHHIRPVESARSIEEMERLCFNPSNLMSLCIPCHVSIHKEMGKGSKSNHQEREQERMERWKERHEAGGRGKADRTRANMHGTQPGLQGEG